MVSKQSIPILGLQTEVYGLEEYKSLPKGTPVAVVFALHGRLQNQSKMQPISESLCSLNQSGNKRHLLVVTFDAPNHGSRLTHKLANFAWSEGKHKNPNHAVDMWSMVNSTARTVTDLMDVLEHYLFGPQPESLVKVWGVIGFSMGGHSTFMAAASDPRITVAIPVVGTSDFLGLMRNRLAEGNLPADTYLPKPFCDVVDQRVANLDKRLASTHLLMFNGGNDKLVKAEFNEALVAKLDQKRRGGDWDYIVVPNVGHAWCDEMVDKSVAWVNKWMIQGDGFISSKL